MLSTLKRALCSSLLIATAAAAQQQSNTINVPSQTQTGVQQKGQQSATYHGAPSSKSQSQALQNQGQGSQYHGHGAQNQGQGSQYHGHGAQNQGQGPQYHGHGAQNHGWHHNGRWWGKHSGNWGGVYWFPNIYFLSRGHECIKSCYRDHSGVYCNVKCY